MDSVQSPTSILMSGKAAAAHVQDKSANHSLSYLLVCPQVVPLKETRLAIMKNGMDSVHLQSTSTLIKGIKSKKAAAHVQNKSRPADHSLPFSQPIDLVPASNDDGRIREDSKSKSCIGSIHWKSVVLGIIIAIFLEAAVALLCKLQNVNVLQILWTAPNCSTQCPLIPVSRENSSTTPLIPTIPPSPSTTINYL